MSYIDEARAALTAHEPLTTLWPELEDLYLLLLLVKGENVTSRDVHDAWAVWMFRRDPLHPSLVLFDNLPPHVQELDDQYRNAIIAAAQQRRHHP